jgi:hypothetical protein
VAVLCFLGAIPTLKPNLRLARTSLVLGNLERNRPRTLASKAIACAFGCPGPKVPASRA